MIIYKLEGSHWHFQDRYPNKFDYYSPSYKQIAFNGPDKNQRNIFVNTYDNSILHTDFVVAEIINYLKKENGEASLSFISDHGIGIYEDGKTLYGGFSKANYNIAYFYWLNNNVKHRLGENRINMLKGNIHKPVDQTYFIDTLFDIAGISSNKKVGKNLFDYVDCVDNRKVLKGKNIVLYSDIER